MKKHLLIFFLMAFSVFCFAAESENISVPNKAIGFSFDWGTEEFGNFGICYQQWFDNSLGLKASVGGFYLEDSEAVLTTNFDLQKKFLTNHFEKANITTILFGWLSGGYNFEMGKETSYRDEYSIRTYAAGLGIGIDIIFSEHISYPIKAGFVSSYGNSFLVNFSMGAAFCYRF